MLSILLGSSAVVLGIAIVIVGHTESLLVLTVMSDECFVIEAGRFGVWPLDALDLRKPDFGDL